MTNSGIEITENEGNFDQILFKVLKNVFRSLSTTFLSTKLLSVKYILYIIRRQYEVTIDGKILPTFYRSFNAWNSLFEFLLLRVTTWLDDLLKRRGWNLSHPLDLSRVSFFVFSSSFLFLFSFSYLILKKVIAFYEIKMNFNDLEKKKKYIWFLGFIFCVRKTYTFFRPFDGTKVSQKCNALFPITSFIAHNSK